MATVREIVPVRAAVADVTVTAPAIALGCVAIADVTAIARAVAPGRVAATDVMAIARAVAQESEETKK